MSARGKLRWAVAILVAGALGTSWLHPAVAEPTTRDRALAAAPDEEEKPNAASALASAPAPTPDTATKPHREALRNLGRDAAYLLTFTERPTRRGKRNAALTLAGTALLIFADDELRARAQVNRNDTIDSWGDRVEPFGSAEVVWGAAALIYGGGRLARNDEVSETGRSLLEALLFNEALTQSAKGLFGRAAPGDDPRTGDFFEGGTIFPSGHTSRAFAFATVFAERHGRWGAWIGYGLATLVGLQRVASDVHWTSDVFVGAALGHFTARSVVRRRAERRSGRSQRISIAPQVASGNRSVGFVLRFEPRASRRDSRHDPL